jgi:hypothetical protein
MPKVNNKKNKKNKQYTATNDTSDVRNFVECRVPLLEQFCKKHDLAGTTYLRGFSSKLTTYLLSSNVKFDLQDKYLQNNDLLYADILEFLERSDKFQKQ